MVNERFPRARPGDSISADLFNRMAESLERHDRALPGSGTTGIITGVGSALVTSPPAPPTQLRLIRVDPTTPLPAGTGTGQSGNGRTYFHAWIESQAPGGGASDGAFAWAYNPDGSPVPQGLTLAVPFGTAGKAADGTLRDAYAAGQHPAAAWVALDDPLHNTGGAIYTGRIVLSPAGSPTPAFGPAVSVDMTQLGLNGVNVQPTGGFGYPCVALTPTLYRVTAPALPTVGVDAGSGLSLANAGALSFAPGTPAGPGAVTLSPAILQTQDLTTMMEVGTSLTFSGTDAAGVSHTESATVTAVTPTTFGVTLANSYLSFTAAISTATYNIRGTAASATQWGMVTTGAQSFAGPKGFNDRTSSLNGAFIGTPGSPGLNAAGVTAALSVAGGLAVAGRATFWDPSVGYVVVGGGGVRVGATLDGSGQAFGASITSGNVTSPSYSVAVTTGNPGDANTPNTQVTTVYAGMSGTFGNAAIGFLTITAGIVTGISGGSGPNIPVPPGTLP